MMLIALIHHSNRGKHGTVPPKRLSIDREVVKQKRCHVKSDAMNMMSGTTKDQKVAVTLAEQYACGHHNKLQTLLISIIPCIRASCGL